MLENFRCCRNWPGLGNPVGSFHLAELIFIFWKCSSSWGLCSAQPGLETENKNLWLFEGKCWGDVGSCQFISTEINPKFHDWRLGTKGGSKIPIQKKKNLSEAEVRTTWGTLVWHYPHTPRSELPLKQFWGCSRNTQPDELKSCCLCWVEYFVPESK